MPTRRELSLEIIADPEKWPLVTQLPLKKPAERIPGWPESGYLDISRLRRAGFKVYEVCNYDGSVREKFTSINALLDAGWVVD